MSRTVHERRKQSRRLTRPRIIPPASDIARAVWGLGFVERALAPLLQRDPLRTMFEPIEPAARYRAAALRPVPKPSESLQIMSWNVKFAGGRIDFFFDCHGDRAVMNESEVLRHMEGMAAKIRQVDPDVLLLQEVDVASKRCAYVDMLQWFLDNTELDYGVYASQWKADFIPSDGLGAMDSGSAILSKWPFADASRVALPLLREQDSLTQYFYLRRNVLKAQLDWGHQAAPWFLNVHTEAFSTDGTKRRQIDAFKAQMDALAAQGATVVGGGDLNTLPPGTAKLSRFEDSACVGEFEADDYSAEVGWLDALYEDYAEAIALDEYRANEDAYYSHTTDGRGWWNRRLDYLFTNADFHDGLVHQSVERGGMATMPLSDHAPLTARLQLR